MTVSTRPTTACTALTIDCRKLLPPDPMAVNSRSAGYELTRLSMQRLRGVGWGPEEEGSLGVRGVRRGGGGG